MFITDEKFFCEKLDRSIPALADIDVTYREKGLEAAEKQLADFVRGYLQPEKYFRRPELGKYGGCVRAGETDKDIAERAVRGELISTSFMHVFPDRKMDWEINPTYNQYKEWTWQLSRHHEWRSLGKCYRETGDERYAQAWVDYLMSWCEQAICPEDAPRGATKCWRTIEAGIRMAQSWDYGFYCFYNSPSVNDHVITTFMKSVWEHGYRLRGFASVANWLIMEMAGLIHIVMLFPFFVETKDWEAYALMRLENEIDAQIYPDGFQFELSTGYHGCVLGNYNYVISTASAMDYKLPEVIVKNLERGYEMYIKLRRPNGETPNLNDGSNAAAKTWSKKAAQYFPEREDFKYFATDGEEGKLPDYTSVAMPYAGMASMKTGWGKDDMWCFMESAPFGRGHQHEDKLNVLMHAYGKEVLKDSGNYAYDGSDMRKFVLDTRSHNCAMVDNLSQNRRGKYKWADEQINVRSDLKWQFTETWDTAEGIYNEGYGPQFLDVTHKRNLIFFKKGIEGSKPFALVIDRFISGDGLEHTFQPSYQMDAYPYEAEGCTFTSDMGDGVTMSIIGSEKAEIIIGQYEPLYMGWRSRKGADSVDFEHKKAPCVRYSVSGVNARCAQVLYPSNDGTVDIKGVKLLKDVEDTKLTLVFADGKEIIIDEKDYASAENAEEMLKI